MSGYLDATVRNVWTAIKSGPNFAPWMAERNGHYYEEDETAKDPTLLTKSDCPALIMVPGTSSIAIAPATNVTFDVALPLNFDLRHDARAVDEALVMWELLVRDLHAAWSANRFGAKLSAQLYNIRYNAATVKKAYDVEDLAVPKPKLVFVCWRVEWSCTLLFRRNLAA